MQKLIFSLPSAHQRLHRQKMTKIPSFMALKVMRQPRVMVLMMGLVPLV